MAAAASGGQSALARRQLRLFPASIIFSKHPTAPSRTAFFLQQSRSSAADCTAPTLLPARVPAIPHFRTAARFIFKDQFIELATTLPSESDLYGLGEATLRGGLLLPRNGSIITLWARDVAAAVTDWNLYSAHPFYLQVNKGGMFGQ
jgi:hypothetical protein